MAPLSGDPGSARCGDGDRQLALLRSVLRTALSALRDACGVERGADDLVPETRHVLDAAASKQDDRVLLEVVALSRDVRADLHSVRESDACDLAKRRVRLLRRGRVNAGADAALLRSSAERGRLRLAPRDLTALADELVYGRQLRRSPFRRAGRVRPLDARKGRRGRRPHRTSDKATRTAADPNSAPRRRERTWSVAEMAKRVYCPTAAHLMACG